MNDIYSKGEIIWAKMSGFPWWPAVIRGIYLKRKTKEQNGNLVTRYDGTPTFLVEFFPDRSHGEVSEEKIEKFYKNFQEKSATKKKSLIKAIDLAKKEIFANFKNLPCHILYEILGKKRYREKKHHTQGDCNKKLRREKQSRRGSFSNLSELNDKNSSLGCGNKKISKVIFDDESEEEQYKKESGKNKSVLTSQTISILSNDDNSNEDENESDEISNEKIINKIKCHINNLLKIKIEMRGKEAHKQIISSLDRLNLIFANKNFSFNFDSLAKDLIPLLTSFTLIKSQDIVMKSVDLVNKIRDEVLKELFDISDLDLEKLIRDEEINNTKLRFMEEDKRKEFIELIEMEKQGLNNKNKKITPNKGKRNPSKDENIEDNNHHQNNSSNNNCNKNNKNDKIKYHNEGNPPSDIPTYNFENRSIEELCKDDLFLSFLLKKIVNGEQIVQKENMENGNPSYTLGYYYQKASNASNKLSHLDEQNASLRKRVCLKLYNIIKQALPWYIDENIKKSVLFFEYLARVKDPHFGKTYKEFVELFYKKFKEELRIKKEFSVKSTVNNNTNNIIPNDSPEKSNTH